MFDLSHGRILVTGGAGFIGSALIWELNRRGATDILVADFLGQDENKWKNLASLEFFDYIEADDLLLKLDVHPQSLGNISAIFHLGACSSTTEKDAAYLIRNNFEYTKILAKFALESARRFVYASSAATYGSIAAGLPETVSLSSLRPLNMYGYSKHLFDVYAERAGILPLITGLKYFNVFGPNEWHKGDMASVVFKGFHEIEQKGQISLFRSYRPEFPDGGQRRDFFYVKDAVAATIYLAEHVSGGGIYNLGSGEPNTFDSLAKAIFNALGREPYIEYIDMPLTLREKYQYFTCAHTAKLRSAGFRQRMTPLGEAVKDYVRNYLLPGSRLGDEAKVLGRSESA
jgi:ADP-L-glycero-D-manno-heptose 6-epimerase